MDYLENIRRRKQISKKVNDRYKLTTEEKEWCAQNPLYNEKYEEPCYQSDVIELLPNHTYRITVVLESCNHLCDTIPLIGVVLGKGEIRAHRLDSSTGEEIEFVTKILGVLISKERPVSSFLLKSKNGYMSVKYECQYFDTRMNLFTRESSIVNLAYGMKKEIINEHKVRYTCKHPLDERNTFKALTFTINWEQV